jgi:hypothetical protein
VKAGGMFISAILIIDTFFVSYYLGVHSRTVDVEDLSMKPVEKPVPVKPVPVKQVKPVTPKTEQPKKTANKKGTKSKQAAKKKPH